MQIKTDLHTHTSVSAHAYSTLKENAEYAKSIGLEAIAITNHAPGMPDSAHEWHFDVLPTVVPRKVCGGGITILYGAECSYKNENAELDLPERILKKLDIVIASVHTPAFCPKTAEEHTRTLLNAMDNPYIDILGHIDRVECGADFDLVAKTAAEKGKVIELNNHSLCYHGAEKARVKTLALMEACRRHNTLISVNTDAHYCEVIGHFDYSEKLLEEIGFDENLIVNASLNRLAEFLKTKNKNIL